MPVDLPFRRNLCLGQLREGGKEVGCVHQVRTRSATLDPARPVGDKGNADAGLAGRSLPSLDLLAVEGGSHF